MTVVVVVLVLVLVVVVAVAAVAVMYSVVVLMKSNNTRWWSIISCFVTKTAYLLYRHEN